MISGLVRILLFQGLGELLSKALLPIVPGPVIGLALLVAWLQWRGGPDADLGMVADAFSRYLGVLFVPAAVGVVLYWPALQAHALAVGAALLVSVVLTIAVTALVLRLATRAPVADADEVRR